jgi:hypothetical protein
VFHLTYPYFICTVGFLTEQCADLPPPLDGINYNLVKEGEEMVKKNYTAEQIIGKLREAEVLLSQSNTVAVVTRQIVVSDVTYYHWREEYGGSKLMDHIIEA